MLSAYGRFSPRMAEIGKQFFDKNWIDAPVRPGKAPVLEPGHTFGTITDNGHNLDDGSSCAFSAVGSLSATPAGLDPAGLQSNGGPTETIALQSTSAAVDGGDDLLVTQPQGGSRIVPLGDAVERTVRRI